MKHTWQQLALATCNGLFYVFPVPTSNPTKPALHVQHIWWCGPAKQIKFMTSHDRHFFQQAWNRRIPAGPRQQQPIYSENLFLERSSCPLAAVSWHSASACVCPGPSGLYQILQHKQFLFHSSVFQIDAKNNCKIQVRIGSHLLYRSRHSSSQAISPFCLAMRSFFEKGQRTC